MLTKDQILEKEMENFMKLSNIYIGFMIITIILLGILLYAQMQTNKRVNYLINDSLTTKQNQILETYGKVDAVDPTAVKPQVEQALTNCKDTNVVNANDKGEQTQEACDYLTEFAELNYQ